VPKYRWEHVLIEEATPETPEREVDRYVSLPFSVDDDAAAKAIGADDVEWI
jgi:hypothetical protein